MFETSTIYIKNMDKLSVNELGVSGKWKPYSGYSFGRNGLWCQIKPGTLASGHEQESVRIAKRCKRFALFDELDKQYLIINMAGGYDEQGDKISKKTNPVVSDVNAVHQTSLFC